MPFTKELFESRFVDLYWYKEGSWLKWEDYMIQYWSCGCIWFCFWKIRINIIFKSHDIPLPPDSE